MRKSIALLAAAGAVAAGLGSGLVALPAGAATAPQLHVSLYSNGDSTAVWNTSGDPVLTAGTDAGTSAQVQVRGVHGTQAPAAAPTFTSSPAASAGDPRWVMEFHNGCYLFGDGTAANWDVNPGGAQGVTYATALKDAQACGSDDYLTAAFIVADAGNHGITYTLTNVQYNGAVVQALTSAQAVLKNRLSGKCLNVAGGNYAAGGVLNQYTCLAMWHGQVAGAQRFVYQTFADGSQYLEALAPNSTALGLFVQSTGQGKQLSLTTTLTPYVYLTGGFFEFPNGGNTVMDDRAFSTNNLTMIWGWPLTRASNQSWTLFAA